MNYKFVLITLLFCAMTVSPQQTPKPSAARLLVQGTYEETFLGTNSNGNAEGKLLITFSTARWLRMVMNEVGDAEFSNLEGAPAPEVSGSAAYDGKVKGPGYDTSSKFTGPLAGEDVVLSVPEYSETEKAFKIRVSITPKLTGKCTWVEERDGQSATSNTCQNRTYFITAVSPVRIDDNDDPAKTPDVATFGIELDVEPDVAASAAGGGQVTASEDNMYAWRGAVTSGSKETGFKILLNKTKEQASSDKRGKSIRKLNFTATITPGTPEGSKQ